MAQRIVLVTGGSRGLGKNAALKLAVKGIGILLTYHSNRQAVPDVVAEIEQKGVKATALVLNVGDSSIFDVFASEVVQVLAQKWGQAIFSYLLNNAGIGLDAPLTETSETQLNELVNIQFKGSLLLTQRPLPLLQDGGWILNISSGLARFILPGYATYAAMKGAMEILTRYQAKELGGRGISVNIIAPGVIEADFGGDVVRDNAEVNQHIAAQAVLGHVGPPGDIGDAITVLLSDELARMNAQRVGASGGMSFRS